MSTPVASAVYTNPLQFATDEVLTSAAYNALAADVAFLRARPWLKVIMTGGTTTVAPSSANPTPNTGSRAQLFGGTVSVLSNSGGAGSIGFAAGAGSLPSSISGLYRFHAQALLAVATSTKKARLVAQFYTGAPLQYGYFVGEWVVPNATTPETLNLDFTLPFGSSKFPTSANQFQIVLQTANGGGTGADPTIDFDDGTYGPLATPAAGSGPCIYTYLDVSYEGQSIAGF